MRDRVCGYALTDALIALLILSTSLLLSFHALAQARRTADLAWELRRAGEELAYRMAVEPRAFATGVGSGPDFSWSVETLATGAEQPIAVCRRALTLRSEKTGRMFTASTRETCPLPLDA